MFFKLFIILSCLFSLNLQGRVFQQPAPALAEVFGSNIKTIKKTLILTKKDHQTIKVSDIYKLSSNVLNYWQIKKNNQNKGWALLIQQTVRTKSQSVLVSFSSSGQLLDVRTLAFYEPLNYKPSTQWLELFKNKSPEKIPVISGATISSHKTKFAVNVAQKILHQLIAPEQQ